MSFALITGASKGIGKAFAFNLASQKYNLLLIARSADELKKVCDEIKVKYDVTCHYMALDLSQQEAAKKIESWISENHYDIAVLINNAGFGVFEEVKEASIKTIASMFQVNVIGLIACTQEILAYMLKENKGHIINIASQAGKLATPKSSGYSASKHAVLGFTNSLRMELAKTDIYVTAVNPGPIQTNFFSIADQSGNYEKSVEKFMLTPQYVAEKTVNIIGKPKREVNLPKWMNIGSKMYQLAPGLVEKLAGDAFNRK